MGCSQSGSHEVDSIKSKSLAQMTPKEEIEEELNLDNGGYWWVCSAQQPEHYLYLQNTHDGNARGWKGDPGDQGHFKFEKNEDGTYLMSTKIWPEWHMFMQINEECNVRAYDWKTCTEAKWTITKVKHPVLNDVFHFTNIEQPTKYLYMQNDENLNVRDWSDEDPHNQKCWIFKPVV